MILKKAGGLALGPDASYSRSRDQSPESRAPSIINSTLSSSTFLITPVLPPQPGPSNISDNFLIVS